MDDQENKNEKPLTDTFHSKHQRPHSMQSRVFKGLPRIRWAEDADKGPELAAARDSVYFWWWMFLKESRDYRRALSGRTEEPFASMARDFGRLGDDFDYWWLTKGREIFAEQMALPAVRALEHGVQVNLEQINPKLVLEVPLTIRRATILRQVGKLLDVYHEGAMLRVMKHGTAKRKLYAPSRMRLPTLKVLYDVWKARKEAPNGEWHEIGEKLRLSPAFIPYVHDSKEEIKYKRRCMTLVVQRFHRKAEALIDFAARGDFPRVK